MNGDDSLERLKEKIEDLQDRIRELEITLHGKRAKTGLLAEYQRHDELLARMYAVIWQDPTGQKGILHDIDLLMGRKKDKDETKKYKWAFITAVAAALVTSVLANLDKIKSLVQKEKSPLGQAIERAKHPKGKPIIRYRIRKAKPPDDEPLVDMKELHPS